MTPVHTKAFLIFALSVAMGALAVAAVTSNFAFIMVGVVAALFLATRLGVASRAIPSLRPFLNQTVLVRVWGAPLSTETFTITSIRALSAGLQFYLRPSSSNSSTHLKVAQPTSVQVTGNTAVIQGVKYMQWAGRFLPKAGDAAALTIERVASDSLRQNPNAPIQ